MECSNHHVNFTGCCQCLVASKQVSRPRPSRINLKPSSAHQLGAYNKSNLAVFHITIEKKKCSHFEDTGVSLPHILLEIREIPGNKIFGSISSYHVLDLGQGFAFFGIQKKFVLEPWIFWFVTAKSPHLTKVLGFF